MADITIKCQACGKILTVSEYVDADSLKCACGQKLVAEKATKPHPPPTFISRRQQEAAAENPDELGKGSKVRRRRKRRKRKSFILKIARFELSEYALSWLIFLILAPILGYVRFSDVITDKQAMEDVIFYALCGYGLLYIVVLVDAFNYEFFEGMLSLFIPPYTFFYLFFRSDSFALRAVLGAMTVGFGIDVAVFLYQWGGDKISYLQMLLDPDTTNW